MAPAAMAYASRTSISCRRRSARLAGGPPSLLLLEGGEKDGERPEGVRGGVEGPAPGDCNGEGMDDECDTKFDGGFGREDSCGRVRMDEPGASGSDGSALTGGGTDAVRATGDAALFDCTEAGRGIVGLEKSSRGGITVGRGGGGFAATCLFAALLTSDRSASSSRRCCRSYIMDERTCSMRAVVMSSVTNRLCLARARCKFCEIPSARRARICSYRSAWYQFINHCK